LQGESQQKLAWKLPRGDFLSPLTPELSPSVQAELPLCVDLDGTLVKSDTLYDLLLVLTRHRTQLLLHVPGWVVRGKAYLKARISREVSLDVGRLPYNRPLLEYLTSEHGKGRAIYLTTGADSLLAERVSAHLGIFQGVLASNGKVNLTGSNKLSGLRSQFSETGFAYVGNASPDLELLVHANEAMVANPDFLLASQIKLRKVSVSRRFEDRPSFARVFLKAIRLHQWAKNILLFVPFLLAHTFGLRTVLSALIAFFCFSFCASATYIANDLLDVETDRHHPLKRFRPFASGDLSVPKGVMLAALLLALAALGMFFLPARFALMVLLYVVTTLLYSFRLKRVVLVDVLLLAGLYTWRMMAGSAATSTPISAWLAAFSLFLFLSLAIVKRFSELENLRERGVSPANGRGYQIADLEQLRAFGTASAYASVVVFSLFISNPEVSVLYRHPARMWLIAPLMILWLSRVWLLASRGQLDEDPVIFAIRDRFSLLIGAIMIAVVVASSLK
jgi:4-hydroxybenzoate polyprenyltransferase